MKPKISLDSQHIRWIESELTLLKNRTDVIERGSPLTTSDVFMQVSTDRYTLLLKLALEGLIQKLRKTHEKEI